MSLMLTSEILLLSNVKVESHKKWWVIIQGISAANLKTKKSQVIFIVN